MQVPPELPIPNSAEVEEFRKLYLAQKGVLLSAAEAFDQCCRLVQFVFLMQHALPALKAFAKGQGESTALGGE